MKYMVALVFVLFFSVPASAQHSHSAKGPNGGQTQDVAGVEVELVTDGTSITLHVTDDNHKPVPVKGFTASALVASASAQEPVMLEASGESSFKGTSKAAIAPGATITIMLKTPAGKSGQARFKK